MAPFSSRVASFARVALASLVVASLSCSDEETPVRSAEPVAALGLPAGCQPLLGGADCMLPFPSDFFLTADASMPSGKRVEVTGAARLVSGSGKSGDVYGWMPADGASKTPTILTLLGSAASAEGLVGLLDAPERSATLDSPTLIVEADTGALVPHFVDLDIREPEPASRALVLTPLVGLKPRARYVVAIRRVKGPDGALAATPEGFRRLRDGVTDPSLAPVAARYEPGVFGVLGKAGVARSELQMAWDFSTGSDELTGRDMLRVRELTLAWLQTHQPRITVTQVTDSDDPLIWRTVEGKISVPLFLTGAAPGARLARDAAGAVEQRGETEVDFSARVPRSVRDGKAPGRPLAYGHGFFGSRKEIFDGSTGTIASDLGAVLFGIDWWGMSDDDLGVVIDGLSVNPDQVLLFTERVHQAMASWTVMTAAIRQGIAQDAAFQRPAGGALYDPSEVFFLGISQGHILGGTLAAFNPDLRRVALNVGGASLTQMMFRARPFMPFLAFARISFERPVDQRKYTATLQPLFDRIDPGFWASRVLADKLPGSPADRRVLQQAGLGDSEVPNLGSFLHARLLGLPQLTPTPRPVFGLEQRSGPIDGSAFSLYDMGVDPAEVYRLPMGAAEGNAVHSGLRVRPDVIAQLDRFLRADSQVIAPAAP